MQCRCQCIMDGDTPSRLLNEILEQLQETCCGFSMGFRYLWRESIGSSVHAVYTHAFYQTSHVYGCAHQLLSIGENEHCKMEVHKHVSLWIVGTCLLLPLQGKEFLNDCAR